MLIHPWDAALDDAEWQEWLASQECWGVLAVNNVDPSLGAGGGCGCAAAGDTARRQPHRHSVRENTARLISVPVSAA